MSWAPFLLALLLNPGFSFLSIPRSPMPFWTEGGAWASLENPAEKGDDAGLSLSHFLWFEDARVSVLSLRSRAWTLGLSYFDQGAVEYMGEVPDDAFSFTFRPYALELQLMRAFQVDPELRVGLGASYFSQNILSDRALGGLLHAGLLYQPARIPTLRLGFFVRNFGIKTGFEQVTYKMPTRLGLYGAYRKGPLRAGFLIGKIWTFPYPETPTCEEGGSWVCQQRAAIGRFFKHLLSGPGSYRRVSAETSLRQMRFFLMLSWGALAEAARVGATFPVKGVQLTYAYAFTRYGFGGIHLVGVDFHVARL